MPNRIAATGHTDVVLVLNMKRFLADDESKKQFEALRGTDALTQAIRESSPVSAHFSRHLRHGPPDDEPEYPTMSTDDVGFATGIFRTLMLERFATPSYVLDKSTVSFPKELADNFQFKNLFAKAWDRWEITIRPTMTGFFVIRLTYRYKARSLLDIARDVQRLQEPLDIPSALAWLAYTREHFQDDPKRIAKTERSVTALLAWLGTSLEDPAASKVLYYPVQWKLAMVAANAFVDDHRLSIQCDDTQSEIRFSKAENSLSLPLHDSYVIYHFDEIYADPQVVADKQATSQAGTKITLSLHDIRKSPYIRNRLTALLEGTVLRERDDGKEHEHFPTPRWTIADNLFEQNTATWNDELCVLSCHSALIIPSRRWQQYDLAVSSTPGSTLEVKYPRYWEAVERMLEFVMEARVLAQLVEGESYRLLGKMADAVERTRSGMFRGDVEFDSELKEQVARAAHLRRVAALAQSLSHPQFWSRTEYAAIKADTLLKRFDIPRIFQHIQHNIDSINSVADHIDELYLADLAEKNSDKTTLLSIGFTAVSLILTLLVLPSFWEDLLNSSQKLPGQTIYQVYLILGTLVALGLIGCAIVLLVMFARRWHDVKEMLMSLFFTPPRSNDA